MTNNKQRKQLTQREGWISIVVNVLLFAVKYWAGIVSGSLALMADAWHTLSDSLSSVIVVAGARLSFKKPDRGHPFGHGRFELVSAIFIGLLLALVGFNFIKQGYLKFTAHEQAQYGTIAIVVTIVSIVVKECLARYAFWGYRKTGSNTLKADGWHHRSDALSSVVILVGIMVGKYLWWIDAALSVLVSLFLLYAAWQIISQSINTILGEGAAEELELQIKEISNTAAGMDVYVHHIHIHNYILHKEVTLHLCLPPATKIVDAHVITKKIEEAIKTNLNMEATTHIDPLL
jgi:cation diffusion facilitator family transporter